MYYPCSENKGADQLRGHREADLRLCFRLCKLLVFSCTGSYTRRYHEELYYNYVTDIIELLVVNLLGPENFST